MAKTKNTNPPKDLSTLKDGILVEAENYGFAKGKNGKFRNCVIDRSNEIREPKDDNESNFWFGFIREDQPDSGAYEGLSFVIFPDATNHRCLVAIGIGSSSMGKDGDLAANPGFRRSFMRLTGKKDSEAKFFFKLRFDEMETSTPGLQEELNDNTKKYNQAMINTVTKYNAFRDDTPGLLPAAFIVDYAKQDGWNLIKAWLAQYARWRGWDTTDLRQTSAKSNIDNAISACKVDASCPDAVAIKNILDAKKYVVLQGAPGCGKTWTANEVAKKYGNDCVVFTQFHAETTYSDFVYGIRPSLDGEKLAYKGVKGTLLEAIDLANKAAEKKVLLIIDEINRANLANVLGPVFYLFEPNAARNYKLKLGTKYDQQSKEEVDIEIEKLPDNLHVLATMNTADKSLAVVDFALRRRFAWVTLRPHKIDNISSGIDIFDGELFDEVDRLFMKYATDEELNLQPGQSYFMDKNKIEDSIKYGLMPLMKEYFAEGFLLAAKEEFAQLFYKYTQKPLYE